MDPVSLILLLKQLLQGFVSRLPDLWMNRSQTSEIAHLSTDVRYLVDVVDRMSARHDFLQQQVTQGQMNIIAALIQTLRPLNQQLEVLTSPHMLALSPPNSDVVEQFVIGAHRQLGPKLPQMAGLALPEETQDVLTRLVRWQMTYAPYFEGHSASVRYEEWCILIYRYIQYTYFIAVSGNDPGSARIQYFRCIPVRNLYDEADWQQALDIAAAQFTHFIQLPGNGIYDLVARLNANGFQAD